MRVKRLAYFVLSTLAPHSRSELSRLSKPWYGDQGITSET